MENNKEYKEDYVYVVSCESIGYGRVVHNILAMFYDEDSAENFVKLVDIGNYSDTYTIHKVPIFRLQIYKDEKMFYVILKEGIYNAFRIYPSSSGKFFDTGIVKKDDDNDRITTQIIATNKDEAIVKAKILFDEFILRVKNEG